MGSLNGQKDRPLNGGSIPIINVESPGNIYWVEKDIASSAIEDPDAGWKLAHIYFMEQAAIWQNRLSDLSRIRIEKYVDEAQNAR